MKVDDVELQRALDDDAHRDTLVSSPLPHAVLLRRAGAYHAGKWKEVTYTDWNGRRRRQWRR